MGTVRVVLVAALCVPFVVGCNEDNTLGLGVKGENRFSASLSGANVRPVPVATTATAAVTFSIRDPEVGTALRAIAYTLSASNLTSATAAHVHLGGASVANGPILLSLYSNPTDSAITTTQLASGILSESAVVGGVSLDSLMTLMNVGAAYVDVHSTASPAGLIRGQITGTGQQVRGDLFVARALAGTKERPTPVVSTASGSATFELSGAGTIKYTLSVAGITGVTMAHIHTGVADSAGPIAVTLFTTATPTGPFTGPLATGAFTATNIQLPGIGLDSLLRLMRVGRTYVNVHTQLNPSGEIRAQIEPVSVLP